MRSSSSLNLFLARTTSSKYSRSDLWLTREQRKIFLYKMLNVIKISVLYSAFSRLYSSIADLSEFISMILRDERSMIKVSKLFSFCWCFFHMLCSVSWSFSSDIESSPINTFHRSIILRWLLRILLQMIQSSRSWSFLISLTLNSENEMIDTDISNVTWLKKLKELIQLLNWLNKSNEISNS
jgi:hypothetical protein